MELTTLFALQSRGTWLFKGKPYTSDHRWQSRTLTIVGTPFQEACICANIGNTFRNYTSKLESPISHVELFLVHSPLLKESCLVCITPFTYMLKFSGFAHLRSHPCVCYCNNWNAKRGNDGAKSHLCWWHVAPPSAWRFRASNTNLTPNDNLQHNVAQVAEWYWSTHALRNIPKTQNAFKFLLIPGILQFTTLITLHCALHHCSSRDIRRWKLFSLALQTNLTRK
jgi:hypothetical protein